jgi:hypothetical protein
MHQSADLIVPAGGNENTLVSDKLSPNSTTAPNTREHEHKPGPWASNRKFKDFLARNMLNLRYSSIGAKTMRTTPKTIQPPRSELDKPAKERIVEQANKLFTLWGVNISTEMIAHYAHTNFDTIKKHFGTRDHLVFNFLKSLIKQAEDSWKEIEQEHPNDPESQLRRWVLHSEFAADLSGQHEHAQLARAGVDLMGIEAKNPLLSEIEKFWQAERRKIVELCEQARFRDPPGLANKLLLLVQGARNERNCYGFGGPSQKIGEAGDDLMVVHGAQRKPLLEV